MIASISAVRAIVPVSARQAAMSDQDSGFGPKPLLPRPACSARNQRQTCSPSGGSSGPSSAAGLMPVWRSTLSSASRSVEPSGRRRVSAK